MFSSKRAMSVWVSWVLLVGLAVILGTFFLNWARDITIEKTEDIIARNDESVLCAQASLRITGICQDAQTLNINVTNNGHIKVDELQLAMFTIYGEPLSAAKNLSVVPGRSKAVTLVKQGALQQAQIIPVVREGSKRFICQDHLITQEPVAFC